MSRAEYIKARPPVALRIVSGCHAWLCRLRQVMAGQLWRWCVCAIVLGSLAGCALTGPAVASAAEVCPNEAIRLQQGEAALALPDCRAYELVSPLGSVPSNSTVAAGGGERFGYFTYDPYPGTDAEGLYMLLSRGPDGWFAQTVTPPQGGVRTSNGVACAASIFYSSEMTQAVLADGLEYNGVCEGDDPPLVSGEPRGVTNLFLRDNESGSYQLIDMVPEGVSAKNALLRGATPELSHVLFSDEAALTPEAPIGADLYEWSAGALRLVTFLPGGSPVPGGLANGPGADVNHAVSANGERVFFNAEGDLFVRLNAMHESSASGGCGEPEKACTMQVDAVQTGTAGSGGGGVFVDASEDGSRVFFTDEHRLTANSRATNREPDLYEYDVETDALSDLTVPASGAGDVLGYAGASQDGEYLYFVAEGVLSEQASSQGLKARKGKPNLYLYHDGTITFIATLDGARDTDEVDWREEGTNEGFQAGTSPSGRYLAFTSVYELTGFDNEPAEPDDCVNQTACKELFRYNATSNELVCVSCAAGGGLPTGPANMSEVREWELLDYGVKYAKRSVFDDGRVFFQTRSPLVPQATDGAVNVYEYENGGASLISTGTGVGESEFLDASASGNDVFFSTAQSLVQADTDNGLSVYDARVGGGFASQSGEGGEAQACESAEACKPPAGEAPAQLFPASAAFSGPGDLTAAPKELHQPPAEEKVGKRGLTRPQKLARALKACQRKPPARQATCRAQARRRFGVKTGGKTKGGGRR